MVFSLIRQWLPKSKMAPFGVNKMLDRMKLMEARSSSVRKSVRLAFDRAMNHLDRARELKPNTGLGVTIWSPATSRILPSLNHVFVTAENTVSAVYAQHKHILFTMSFKLEPNHFHPSSHTGSTSLKYCSLKQLFLFVKSYAMKNVFVSGFKKLTGEKKQIKSWLRGLKSSRSKPVECGRVWPLTSLNVLQDCCNLTAMKLSIIVCDSSSSCKYPVQGLTLIYSFPQSVLVHSILIFIQWGDDPRCQQHWQCWDFCWCYLYREKIKHAYCIEPFYFTTFCTFFCKLLSSSFKFSSLALMCFCVCFFFFLNSECFYWTTFFFFFFYCLYIFI